MLEIILGRGSAVPQSLKNNELYHGLLSKDKILNHVISEEIGLQNSILDDIETK
jgi:hypothetical protein